MKKLMLTILACGMLISGFAQIDTLKRANPENADKWVINKVNAKTSTGKLVISLPKGTAWDITIYNAGTNKVVSNTMLKTTFPLAPGSYDLEVNHIWVKGVQIEKGNTTRLKAGVLDVTTTGAWTLYDETKETVLINTYHPQKRGLPVGKYILSEAGQDRAIEIRDSGSPESENIPQEHFTIDAEKYTMTRVPNGEDTAMQTKGRLVMRFPLASHDAFFRITSTFAVRRQGESTRVIYCHFGDGPFCNKTYPLEEGLYDVDFSVRSGGNPVKISGVQIRKGFETRMKVGYLAHSARGLYQMVDSTRQYALLKYDSQGPAHLPVPIGSYWLHLPFVGEFPVTIKDGEVTSFKSRDTNYAKIKTAYSKISGDQKLISSKGRLNTSFPEDSTVRISIRLPNPNSNLGYDVVRLDTVKTYDLLPGNYKVYLNAMLVDVTIRAGQETRIRFGYLSTSSGAWKLSGTGQNSTGGIMKLALPIGYYSMMLSNHNYLIKITEGETMLFRL